MKPVIGRVEAVDMDEGLNSILHFSGNSRKKSHDIGDRKQKIPQLINKFMHLVKMVGYYIWFEISFLCQKANIFVDLF